MTKANGVGATSSPVTSIPYRSGFWNDTFDGGLPIIHYGETSLTSWSGKRDSSVGS